MGLWQSIFKKKSITPKYTALIPFFEEAFSVLSEHCDDKNVEYKNSDTATIGTSASAIVAASYFVNSVLSQNNKKFNREKLANEVVETSNIFFNYISKILAEFVEADSGNKVDLNNWLEPVSEVQRQKTALYIKSITSSINKIKKGGSGFDITTMLYSDIFENEEDVDLIFHHKLITLILSIKI